MAIGSSSKTPATDGSRFASDWRSASKQLAAAAEARGERIVLWSVDPRDWQPGASSPEIVRAVLQAVRPGSIVILHDGGGDRSATVRAAPAIIRAIRRRGLRLVAVSMR